MTIGKISQGIAHLLDCTWFYIEVASRTCEFDTRTYCKNLEARKLGFLHSLGQSRTKRDLQLIHRGKVWNNRGSNKLNSSHRSEMYCLRKQNVGTNVLLRMHVQEGLEDTTKAVSKYIAQHRNATWKLKMGHILSKFCDSKKCLDLDSSITKVYHIKA